MEIYPWHQKQFNMLKNAISSGYVPVNLLLSGEAGCGLEQFARMACKLISCRNSSAKLCDNCISCNTWNNGNYQDLSSLNAVEYAIGISDIREIIADIYHTPVAGDYKFLIIEQVERLTNQALNALLKTLEEPPKHAIFIMISYHKKLVPATIRSRAQELFFPIINKHELQQYLYSKNVSKNTMEMYKFISNHHPTIAHTLHTQEDLEGFMQFIGLISDIAKSKGELLSDANLKKFTLLEFINNLKLLLEDLVRLQTYTLNEDARTSEYIELLKNINQMTDLKRIYKVMSIVDDLYYQEYIAGIKANKTVSIDSIILYLFYKKEYAHASR